MCNVMMCHRLTKMLVHAKVYAETIARMSITWLDVRLYLMAEHEVMEIRIANIVDTKNGVE